MGTRIRSAVVGDETVLAGLNRFVHALHVENRPDHFRPTELAELVPWYRARLEEPATRMWIAEEDGSPVGYLLAILHERSGNPFTVARRYCEIDQIAVDPQWRRQGVARALILEAVASARAEGIHVVEAASWSFNDHAQATFRHLGFVPKTVRFELT